MFFRKTGVVKNTNTDKDGPIAATANSVLADCGKDCRGEIVERLVNGEKEVTAFKVSSYVVSFVGAPIKSADVLSIKAVDGALKWPTKLEIVEDATTKTYSVKITYDTVATGDVIRIWVTF